MALITKKEFAELCGKTTAWLSNYNTTTRKTRVVVRTDGMLDTSDPVNRAFLQKHAVTADDVAAERPAKPVKKAAKAKQEVQDQPADDESEQENEEPVGEIVLLTDGKQIDLNTIPPSEWEKLAKLLPAYHISEQVLKFKDTLKRDEEIKKLQLEIQKKRGEVIPVAPIEVLVFQFKQYVLTQQKLAYEAFLNEIGHKYSIAPEDMGEYRGYFIKKLNECMVTATDNFTKNLDSTMAEYSIKKGVGERES